MQPVLPAASRWNFSPLTAVTRSSSGFLCALVFIWLFCCRPAACEDFFSFFSASVGTLPSLASCVLAPLSFFHGLHFSYLSVCIPAAFVWHCVYSCCIICVLSSYLMLLIYNPHSLLMPAPSSLFLQQQKYHSCLYSLVVSERLGKLVEVVVKSRSNIPCL